MICSTRITCNKRFWKRVCKSTNACVRDGINPVIKNCDNHKEIELPVNLHLFGSDLFISIPDIPDDYVLLNLEIIPFAYNKYARKHKNCVYKIYITKRDSIDSYLHRTIYGTDE